MKDEMNNKNLLYRLFEYKCSIIDCSDDFNRCLKETAEAVTTNLYVNRWQYI
jgi:hypothetical protein